MLGGSVDLGCVPGMLRGGAVDLGLEMRGIHAGMGLGSMVFGGGRGLGHGV